MSLLATPPLGNPTRHVKTVGQILFACDDDSCIYFADRGGAVPFCFDVYVIDVSGAQTWYRAAGAYNVGVGGYIKSLVPIGAGNFLVTLSNGRFYHVTVGNSKLNNSSPILIKPNSGFTNSCYDSGGLASAYYDSTNRVIAVSWTEAVGQNGAEIYSSIYQVYPNGALSQLVDGWTTYSCSQCSPPVAGDPIIYDQTVGPSNSYFAAAQLTNGLAVTDYNIAYTSLVLSRQGYRVTIGKTASSCSDSNLNSVSLTSNDSLYIPVSLVPNFSAYDFVDTNINGLTGLCFQYNGDTVVYAVGDNVLFAATLLPPAGHTIYEGNVVLTRKNLFLLDGNLTGIYYAPSTAFYNGYNAQKRGLDLINGARPISITGKYKA